MTLSFKQLITFVSLLGSCAVWLSGCQDTKVPNWLTPPPITDLQPKFRALQTGMTPEAAATVMGTPTVRHENTTAGVTHIVLAWNDSNSSYTARFLAGHLYTKTQGPLISLSKG